MKASPGGRHSISRTVPAVVLATAVGGVLSAGVVAALVLPTTSDTTSVLHAPVAVTVTTPEGAASPGRNGQVIAPGDLLTVGHGAGAGAGGRVTTGARTLWLGGAGTQVRIDGPASTEVRSGSVVAVDPGRQWALQADQITVSGITGAVRIDYGYEIRVAAYAGLARLDAPTGARANLTGLRQLGAAGSILAGASTPLKLSDDALDTAAAPALVTLDRGLNALAAQTDADPALRASFRAGTPTPSERLLPAAIAAAGHGGTLAARTSAALTARAQQGSWGVIASLADVQLAAVREQLAPVLNATSRQLLAAASQVLPTAPSSSAPAGASPAALGAGTVGTVSAPAAQATSSPAAGGRPAAAPAASSSTSAGSTGMTSGTSPSGTTSSAPVNRAVAATPTPAASPVLTVLLNTVGGLVARPTPTPSAGSAAPAGSASAAPTTHASSPTPATGLGALLTGLLGGGTKP